MKAIMRAYRPDDFLRVRDFLKTAYYSFGRPTNWGLERWNWGRYHPSVFDGDALAHIRHFESSVTLWEEGGHIVAVLNTEGAEPSGEAYIQRLPEADPLLDEILERAEATLALPDGSLRVDAYDHDAALTAALSRRGYRREGWDAHWSEIEIGGIEEPSLPPGFRIMRMAEAGADPAERCRVQGLGFDHPDPAEWMTPEQYRRVQEAPDYSPENDLVVVSPDGDYASMCIVWHDDLNRFGVFEPVCTPPRFRRMGLGRAVIRAGLNRLWDLGARMAYVGSGQEFYAAIGFRREHVGSFWALATG